MEQSFSISDLIKTKDARRNLCGSEVEISGRTVQITLNGKKAGIYGAYNPYASVCILPDGNEVEFAWPTVLHILTREKNPGAFKS